jgi:hypothetical protein
MKTLENFIADRYGCGVEPSVDRIACDIERLIKAECCERQCHDDFCVTVTLERLRAYLSKRLKKEKPPTHP